jgi:hypothetical protein
MKTMPKIRQVINFLTTGRPLNATTAKSKFGVRNLRATISSARKLLEQYGNWEIVTDTNSKGDVCYTLVDTHPGTRTYGFRKDGSRYAIA